MYNRYEMYRNMMRNMNRTEQTEINVVGTSTELVSPDIGVITIDITSVGSNPTETEFVNSKRIDKILQSLKKLGVQSKDIEAQQQIIAPILDEEGAVVEYHATTFLTITFYDLATIGEFYYNIKTEGINVTQIILTNQNVHDYYYKALDSAIKSAFIKADIFADNMPGHLIPTPSQMNETSSIIHILEDIIITDVETLDNIELTTLVIPATVEATFLIESVKGE